MMAFRSVSECTYLSPCGRGIGRHWRKLITQFKVYAIEEVSFGRVGNHEKAADLCAIGQKLTIAVDRKWEIETSFPPSRYRRTHDATPLPESHLEGGFLVTAMLGNDGSAIRARKARVEV